MPDRKQIPGLPEATTFNADDFLVKRDTASGTDQKIAASLVSQRAVDFSNAAVFDSVADMQFADWLVVGQKCRTLGYSSPGDGGGNDYEIVAAGTGGNYGFLFEQLTASGHEAKLLGGGIMEDKTAYIPSDYATLQEAIDDLSKISVSSGAVIDLMIESGHQPASGAIVENGDYGYFKISSVSTPLTLSTNFGKSNAFVLSNKSVAPSLNCLVDANGQASAGYRVSNSSMGHVEPSSGVINCWGTGLLVEYGSNCSAENTVWTSNALNGSTSSGILCLSSVVHANGSDVSDSAYYGAQASEGGILSFRNGNASRTGRYGLRARNGGFIDCEGATCSDNAVDGIRAFMGGKFNARYLTAENNLNADIWASRSSTIEAGDATLGGSNSVACVYAAANSFVDCTGSTMSSGTRGIYAEKASSVSSDHSLISNMSIGIHSIKGSSVSASNATIQDGSAYGILAESGGRVSALSITIQNISGDGVRSRSGGNVTIDSGLVTDITERGIIALNGGSISASGANVEKTPGQTSGGAIADINVNAGGTVYASGATGGVNVTENTLTSSGFIIR